MRALKKETGGVGCLVMLATIQLSGSDNGNYKLVVAEHFKTQTLHKANRDGKAQGNCSLLWCPLLFFVGLGGSCPSFRLGITTWMTISLWCIAFFRVRGRFFLSSEYKGMQHRPTQHLFDLLPFELDYKNNKNKRFKFPPSSLCSKCWFKTFSTLTDM